MKASSTSNPTPGESAAPAPPPGHEWFDGTKGHLNTPDAVRHAQMRINIRRHLPQALPGVQTDLEAILACGGPSLATHLKTIRRLYRRGAKLITVNGTHDYMIAQAFQPFVHVMIDSRAFNARFVQNPVESCRYFISSGCHPSVFDALEGYRVGIFHPIAGDADVEILDGYYGEGHWLRIGGGTTVACRAVALMTQLGLNKFHIFGFDSCYMGDRHHAYVQRENDERSGLFQIAGKHFRCSPWMVKQYEDWFRMMKEAGDLFHARVYGKGVIAHAMQTGAKLEDLKEPDDGTR